MINVHFFKLNKAGQYEHIGTVAVTGKLTKESLEFSCQEDYPEADTYEIEIC